MTRSLGLAGFLVFSIGCSAAMSPGPAPSPPSHGGGTPSPNPDPGSGNPGGSGMPSGELFVGYLQSWSQPWKATGAETQLAHLPGYLDVVNLTFMRPDASYVAGSHSLSGTGLDFPYDGPTLRDAIAALHGAHPGTRVLVSVGGASYATWTNFNAATVAAFITDFALDGVDLDYEPANPSCAATGGHVTCGSDAELISVVSAFRAAIPRPAMVSIASWSVGAYGEGAWANAQPASAYAGISLALFRSNAAQALDLVNVMSYDAGPTYDPAQALAAYQSYFKGAVVMGVEVPPEAWGGHIVTIGEVQSLADTVMANHAAGMMLWSIEKQPSGAASPSNPDAQLLASAVCTKLSLGDCTAPIVP